jgi:hypothetical protein
MNEESISSSVKHCERSPGEQRAWLFYRNRAYALWRTNVEQAKTHSEYLEDANCRIAELEILVEEQEQEMNELIRRIEVMKVLSIKSL